MIRIGLFTASILSLLIAFVLGGFAPFGRLALALDLPQVAASLFGDPAWRATAHYRAGDYLRAERSYAKAGPDEVFNQGNALVHSGHYAAALEAYDLALSYDPSDTAARSNFDLVSAYYAGTEIEPFAPFETKERDNGSDPVAAETAQGSARAAGTGDAVTNNSPLVGLPELDSRDRLGVRKVFDDKFVVASPRWLATLEDVPGAFLAARIAQEHKRRAKAGIGQEEPDDPR